MKKLKTNNQNNGCVVGLASNVAHITRKLAIVKIPANTLLKPRNCGTRTFLGEGIEGKLNFAFLVALEFLEPQDSGTTLPLFFPFFLLRFTGFLFVRVGSLIIIVNIVRETVKIM